MATLRETILGLFPAAYWRLGELSGTAAADSTTMASFPGTYVATPALNQVGVVSDDQAVLLTAASSQRVDIAGTPRIMEGDGTFTGWVKLTVNAGNMCPMGEGASSSDNRYAYMQLVGGALRFVVFTTGGFVQSFGPAGSVLDGNWHHLAAVKRGTNIEAWVDGVSGAPVAFTGNLTGLLDHPQLGALWQSAARSQYFGGTLDEVAWFRYALTSAEIGAIYAAGIGQMKTPALLLDVSYGTNAWAEPLWADESWRVRSFKVQRGRQHELAQFDAGKSTVMLVDNDRALDPSMTAAFPLVPPSPNLLSYNQSSLEDGTTTGWGIRTNVSTMVSSTAQAAEGKRSLLITSTAAGAMNVETTPGTGAVPIIGGAIYKAVAAFRAVAAVANCYVQILYYDALGALITAHSGAQTADTAVGFTEITITDTAPANAAYASVVPTVVTAGAAEQHYIDNVGLYLSVAGPAAWVPGSLAGGMVSHWKLAELFDPQKLNAGNLLSYADTTFEGVPGFIHNWNPITNCSSTTVLTNGGLHGTNRLRIIAAAAGAVEAGTLAGGLPVYAATPGVTYTAVVNLLATSVLRSCQVRLLFYDGTNTPIGTGTLGVSVTTVAGVYLPAYVSAKAPATAAKLRVSVLAQGAAGAGEGIVEIDVAQVVALVATDAMAAHTGYYSSGVKLGVPGRVLGDTVARFDGVDDFVDTGDLSLFETGDCTYSVWVRFTSAAGSMTVFSEGTSAGLNGWSAIRASNGATGIPIAVATNDAGTIYSANATNPINDGRWHHLVLVKKGTTILFYVDGVSVGIPPTLTGTFTQNQSRIGALGRSTDSEFFPGDITAVSVWSRALNATEVAMMFAKPPNPNDHVGQVTAGVRHRLRAQYAGVTYPIFDHVSERWEPHWANPVWAQTELQGVDAFKAFKRRRIVSTAYRAQIVGLLPSFYYRFNDTGSMAFKEERRYQPDAIVVGTVAQGAAGAIAADVDAAADLGNMLGYISLPVGGLPFVGQQPFTIEIWAKIRTVTGSPAILSFRDGTTPNPHTTEINIGASTITGTTHDAALNTIGVTINNRASADGLWHHLVFVRRSATVGELWIDGVLAGSNTAGTAPTLVAPTFGRVGSYGFASSGATLDAIVDELAIYPTALAGSTIAANYALGAGNFGPAKAGVRLGATLDVLGWSAFDRDLDTGQSTLQAGDSSLALTKGLDYMQKVEETDAGMLFMSADRKVTFRDRSKPLVAPGSTSKATFGDGTGEIPYEPAPSMWLGDDDAYGEATTSRKGGATMRAFDQTALDNYEGGTISHTDLLLLTDNESADRSNWELSTRKTPQVRVGTLRIHCTANPALIFPTLFGLTFGDRVTVKRRPPPLTSQVWSADMIVEGITFEEPDDGDWWAELAVTAANPFVGSYWILGTGLLGTSTRLTL